MSSVNKVILIGNLGRDPETRYMSSGDCVTNFSIATSDKWVDKQSGEKTEKIEWHNIVAFRKLGEICGLYLKKGSSIYCEGKLNTQKYTGKDGVEKYQTRVIIDSMQMLGGKNNEPNQENKAVKPKNEKQVNQVQSSSGFDDDIPF